MKKKTLLFVTPCLSFAGAEKILCWVADEFANVGYKVQIVNLNLVGNNSYFKRKPLENVEVVDLNIEYKKGLNNYYRVKKIAKIAKQNNAEAIIAFTRYPCILAVLAGKWVKIPVITSERGDPYQYKKGIRNKIGFLILNKADGCVFQTENAMKAYSEKLIKRSRVIPNPVFNNGLNHWKDNNGLNVISVGRLDNYQKRYDVMIKGFSIFVKSHPEYSLEIFGKGLDEKMIMNIAKNSGASSKIYFRGLTTNTTAELLKARIFLITSDFEGIPNSLLEAMAIGMPVISTTCSPGGAEFLIKDHKNGLLVSCGDPEAVAAALSEFADNTKLLLTCAQNAYDTANQFNPQRIFIEWKRYVESILN